LQKDMKARLARVVNEVPWLPGGPNIRQTVEIILASYRDV
jgi:hypothetical protein